MARLTGITLLAIVIVVGMIAAINMQTIERALMPQPAQQLAAKTTHMATSGKAQATAAAKPVPTMPTGTGQPVATQGPQAMVLGKDTFQRANQALWGAASDGQQWEGDANRLAVFSVAGAQGQIAGVQGQGQQVYAALLGGVNENVDIVSTASVSLFDTNTNFGVVLRWRDANNWYKAFIDGTELVVLKRVNGVTTRLGAIRFPAQAGKLYTLHFRAIGATLFASAWQAGNAGPGQWMLVVSDMSLVSGQGGVRVVVDNGAVMHLSSFLETAASSGV